MMTEQLPYSVFVRHAEPSVLPTAGRYGLGVLVWSPLNMGWLAGKYRREEVPGSDTRAARNFARIPWSERDDPAVGRKYDLVDALTGQAREASRELDEEALGPTTLVARVHDDGSIYRGRKP